MKKTWLNRVFPIATIFSFRMLGLFMLIPVFTIYAPLLNDANAMLIGVALGSYGLSQGLLQIPFGMLSDRFGRKPIITMGLVLFALGSLLGAYTDSIYGIIIARIIQGTGAIGSVLITLLADLTPDDERTKAMAVIGITIGLSFSLAMVISPAITHHFGLSGIFCLTTLMAVIGLIMLYTVIPTPKKEPFHLDSTVKLARLKPVLTNHHLQRLNIGIFCQHLILTSTFFSIPLLLQKQIKLGHLTHQWHFYLPLMVGAFVMMLPFIIFAEKKRHIKSVFVSAVVLTGISQFVLAFYCENWYAICVLMFLYFLAFNFLEANLPSLISRQSPIETKGTAMGVYSSSQFLGIFVGGLMAGILYQTMGNESIFITNSVIALIWFFVALFMQPDVYQLTLLIPYTGVDKNKQQVIDRLRQLSGVNEAVISPDENMIYLRVDKLTYQRGTAEDVLM